MEAVHRPINLAADPFFRLQSTRPQLPETAAIQAYTQSCLSASGCWMTPQRRRQERCRRLLRR